MSVRDAATVGSAAWRSAELVALLRHLSDALADNVDSVVVTYGTDTTHRHHGGGLVPATLVHAKRGR